MGFYFPHNYIPLLILTRNTLLLKHERKISHHLDTLHSTGFSIPLAGHLSTLGRIPLDILSLSLSFSRSYFSTVDDVSQSLQLLQNSNLVSEVVNLE